MSDLDKKLIGEMHVSKTATPQEAGRILGRVWCESPTELIDIWGEEWTGKAFINEFLNVCKDRGQLLKALSVRWMVHNCPGPKYDFCTNDMVDRWVIEWVVNNINVSPLSQQLKEHDILVAAHRTMFQSFVEAIKSEKTD